MNIDDIDPTKFHIPNDIWKQIFADQRKLAERYDEIEEANGFPIPHSKSLHDRLVQYRIKDFMWRTTEEIAEALEHEPPIAEWRDEWNDNGKIRHFFEELVDSVHFFAELSIMAQFNPEEIKHVAKDAEVLVADDPDWGDVKMYCGDFVWAMGLAANMLKNKPWKQTHMETDVDRFKRQLRLCWSRYCDIIGYLGMTWDEFYVLYARKYAVNVFRQDTKY